MTPRWSRARPTRAWPTTAAPYDEADVAAAELVGRAWDERLLHERHLETHRRIARLTARMVALVGVLCVVIAVNSLVTVYSVWLHFGGRWPWQ